MSPECFLAVLHDILAKTGFVPSGKDMAVHGWGTYEEFWGHTAGPRMLFACRGDKSGKSSPHVKDALAERTAFVFERTKDGGVECCFAIGVGDNSNQDDPVVSIWGGSGGYRCLPLITPGSIEWAVEEVIGMMA